MPFPFGSEALTRLASPAASWPAGLVCLLLLSLPAPRAAGETLRAGATLRGELAGGQTRELVVEAPAAAVSALGSESDDGVLRLTVEQLGVDVAVEVAGTVHDAPFDRRNLESVVLPPGRSRVILRGREAGAPAGRFVVRLEEVPGGERSVRLPLLRAESEAARSFARRDDDPQAPRAALDLYRFAADGWEEEGSGPDAARTRYAAAVLHRLLDETEAGLALAEDAAARWRRLGEPVFEAYAWNEVGLDRWLLGRADEARSAFRRALELSDTTDGDRFVAGAAAGNLCLLDFVAGDLRTGLACYERPGTGALARLRAAGARALTGAAETSVGRAYDVLGEPERARRRYAEALESLRVAGDAAGEARALVNLGALHRELGAVDEALDAYDRALAAFRREGDRRWQARTLNNLGYLYLELGEEERAREPLRAALDLWRAVDDPRGEAHSLTNLARVAMAAGDPAAALPLQLRALDRARAASDTRAEANALSHLGAIRSRLPAETAKARGDLGRAAELFREIEDPASEALALRRLAVLDLAGDPEGGRAAEARGGLLRSLELAREAGHRAGEAEALTALARAERALGRPAEARARVAAAAETLDALRVRIASPELRTSHAALRHDTYELWIDLLMEAGADDEALAVVETVRARTLAELLQEAGVEAARGVPRALLDRRRELEARLRAKVERAVRGGGSGAGRETLAREAADVLRELDAVEARIRRESPALAALTRPATLDAAGIRRLLDEDTLLLVYALGEERSFLWAVTREGVESFPLPPRRTIDRAVRRHHRRLSENDPAARHAEAEAGAELSRTLLGPAAKRLAGHPRLAVVADGALHYLPFAALPLPGGGGAVLDAHEVVYLPSVSALAASRRATAGRPRPAGRVAVVADPVFGADDPRVLRVRAAGAGTTASGASTASADRDARFVRLPASRREALDLAARVPRAERKILLGFEAERRSVVEGGLGGYGVVHFATHGVIDEDEPALSGLALSRVDPAGRPRDGFLGLREIYDMALDADLVVLSACRTALGPEVRGEGMLGLTRGFLHAGARRVVASLWKVEDGATAELMSRFYRALWEDGLPAPAALRRAQRELRAERRHRDPADWAGFVLVGDWR